MTRIKFDSGLIQTISLIQKITHCSVKDCIEGDRLLIIVGEKEVAKAVGKSGTNVRKIEKVLNRKIKIVEFNPELIQFIKNLIFPLEITGGEEENGIITIAPRDTKTRGYIIGRNAQNLRMVESIVKRYFPIKEIKV